MGIKKSKEHHNKFVTDFNLGENHAHSFSIALSTGILSSSYTSSHFEYIHNKRPPFTTRNQFVLLY